MDKRDSIASSIGPPAPPKRPIQKRSTEWSVEDDSDQQSETNDLRDSGISTASLLDFNPQLTHLNNLSYEDFVPRTKCNEIMNISPPSVINALNTTCTSNNFPSGTFHGSQILPDEEVKYF